MKNHYILQWQILTSLITALGPACWRNRWCNLESFQDGGRLWTTKRNRETNMLRLRSIWLFHCSSCRRFSISAMDTPAAARLPAMTTKEGNWHHSYCTDLEVLMAANKSKIPSIQMLILWKFWHLGRWGKLSQVWKSSRRAWKSISTSTIVVSPDPLSSPSTSSTMKTTYPQSPHPSPSLVGA